MQRYFLLVLTLVACFEIPAGDKPVSVQQGDSLHIDVSYVQLRKNVIGQKKIFAMENCDPGDPKNLSILQDFWIKSLLHDFYSHWANTPWDFNGTTEEPGKGAIACGYFVTTLLRDMDVKIQRVKLAVCPSAEMMESIVPHQSLMNLSSLTYPDFDKRIKQKGKGVYIIGLDYHTGFIINDGSQNWFLHSNYINQQGVIKETILESNALRASKTRWLVSLTSDTDFLTRWMKDNMH